MDAVVVVPKMPLEKPPPVFCKAVNGTMMTFMTASQTPMYRNCRTTTSLSATCPMPGPAAGLLCHMPLYVSFGWENTATPFKSVLNGHRRDRPPRDTVVRLLHDCRRLLSRRLTPTIQHAGRRIKGLYEYDAAHKKEESELCRM